MKLEEVMALSGDELEQAAIAFMPPGRYGYFPTDIAAAWRLVEASALQFQMGNTKYKTDSWWAKFGQGKKLQVFAETPAKAITRAFVLAMESNED